MILPLSEEIGEFYAILTLEIWSKVLEYKFDLADLY